MSETLSQIYAKAKLTRDNYLQITELNTGRTDSKLSILNLLTYVVSSMIYAYETILDVFEVDIAKMITSRINGTPLWYAKMALLFQYDSDTNTDDKLVVNDDTLKLEYETVNENHRIISNASYDEESDGSLTLKVCKSSSDDAVSPLTPLTSMELFAFQNYMDDLKFVGSVINCVSRPADILTLRNCVITYNSKYATEKDVISNIKTALSKFTKEIDFNGYIYFEAVMNTIYSVDNIINIDDAAELYVASYNDQTDSYDTYSPTDNKYGDSISGKAKAKAGYAAFYDSDGESTVTTGNITLRAQYE